MIEISIIFLVLLFLMSLIDIRYKQIPSMFLTGILFLVLMLQFSSFENGVFHLVLGVFSFLFSYILYEGRFIGGIADVKIITTIGIMLKTNIFFYVFMLVTILLGLLYKLFFVYIMKKEQTNEVPFIPLLFIVYVTMYLIGGL